METQTIPNSQPLSRKKNRAGGLTLPDSRLYYNGTAEISQTGRHILYEITYMWNLKIQQISKYNKKEPDSQI